MEDKPTKRRESRFLKAYKDTGCELYPSCLNCPIPVEECPDSKEGKSPTLHKKKERDESIKKLFKAGKSPAGKGI